MKIRMLINVIILMLLTSCNKAEKEIYLIPAEYTGGVTIIFDCKEGSELEYEAGTRVYKINKDGLLKLNATFNKGLLKPDEQLFYYIDSLGNRTEIKHHKDTPNNAETEEIMIFNYKIHGNCFVNGQEQNNSAVQFLVCTEEEREAYYQKQINPCDFYCK